MFFMRKYFLALFCLDLGEFFGSIDLFGVEGLVLGQDYFLLIFLICGV